MRRLNKHVCFVKCKEPNLRRADLNIALQTFILGSEVVLRVVEYHFRWSIIFEFGVIDHKVQMVGKKAITLSLSSCIKQ